MQQDFESLQILFTRVGKLPELPGSVQKLINVIDTGEASAIDLEKIISADPALSVAILRISTTRWRSSDQISTIRAAVMLLGQQSVRNLATSWMLQGLLQKKALSPLFSAERFVKHSMMTAQTARYVFARRQMQGDAKSTWSADEVFAAALLHDLGIALLACVAPESYERVYAAAERLQISLTDAFEKIYNRKLSELAVSAVRTWRLPLIFEDVVRYVNEPWLNSEQFGALACINYADHLSSLCGCTLEKWGISSSVPFEVNEAAAISEDEVARVLHLVNENIDKIIGSSKIQPDSAFQLEKPAAEGMADVRPSDILVVDDNKINQDLIVLVLEHFGYSCRVASNGSEAVKAFSEQRPLLILMDVNMPIMDGIAAAKEIRQLEKGSGNRTPIIALTALARKNDESLCLSAGMDDHITKPLMIDSFREKISRWLTAKAA